MDDINKYYIEENEKFRLDIENCDEKIKNLLLFFQYKTHFSSKLEVPIDPKYYGDILNELIESWQKGTGANAFECYEDFSDLKKRNLKFDENGLEDSIINLKYKKMVIFYDKNKDRIGDECYYYLSLMRHMRNSIAHGNVYLNSSSRKKVFFFVDYNRKNHCTAKIICTQSDLKSWQVTINKYIKRSHF